MDCNINNRGLYRGAGLRLQFTNHTYIKYSPNTRISSFSAYYSEAESQSNFKVSLHKTFNINNVPP